MIDCPEMTNFIEIGREWYQYGVVEDFDLSMLVVGGTYFLYGRAHICVVSFQSLKLHINCIIIIHCCLLHHLCIKNFPIILSWQR